MITVLIVAELSLRRALISVFKANSYRYYLLSLKFLSNAFYQEHWHSKTTVI